MFRYFLTRLTPKLPDTSIIFPVSKLSLESYDIENEKWCDDSKENKKHSDKETKPNMLHLDS